MLSGGQKQRIAIARSLMMHPDILLCDEPTSGLDATSTKDVASLLQEINEMGVTMVIASHDIKFVNMLTTHIVTLKNGEITV